MKYLPTIPTKTMAHRHKLKIIKETTMKSAAAHLIKNNLKEDSKLEMRLEPEPLQLEDFATNRSRNHHSTHQMGGMVVATSVCGEML